MSCLQAPDCQLGMASYSAASRSSSLIRQSSNHLSICSSRTRLFWNPLCKSRAHTRSKKNATLNKRYGCISTCSRYRVVRYREVTEEHSTDSFINAVPRFVGRPGPPRVIYSANGTNFRGAKLDVLKTLQV